MRVGVGIALIAIAIAGVQDVRGAAQSKSVWDGVYSAAQQKLGDAIYARECSTCHGEKLKGGEGAPALTGSDFLAGWNSKTVGDLYDKVRETMPAPPEQPGKLSPQQNADVVAFILSANAFPPGTGDLPATSDALTRIRISAKR